MPTTNTNPTEEIIEKKASAPVATACLILACVFLIGAIVFSVAEIAAYRSGEATVNVSKGIGQDKAGKYLTGFKNRVDDLLKNTAPGTEPAEGGASSDTPKEATSETEKEASTEAEEKPAEAEEKAAPEEEEAKEAAPAEPEKAAAEEKAPAEEKEAAEEKATDASTESETESTEPTESTEKE